MKSNFQKVMPYIFSEEGGYADNPADPGGATNMGITIATLSAWDGHQASPEDIREMTQATATEIYQAQFWNKIDGDNLPSGIDYALFDFSVNSGPARAARMLQGILDMPEDGIIGAQTVEAANMRSAEEVIDALCDARASWLQGLSTASTFGKGWLARVERVRSRALALAAKSPVTHMAEPVKDIAPKARQSDIAVTSVLKHPEALGTMGSVASGVVAIASGNSPVQYALAIVMIACAVVGLWYFVRRVRNEP
ncbi:glycoside hydrolase family 108 protein [Brucella tritici]|jgi:lysozyme family protein|uniref:Glycoside hydrolase family 108 protein n=1 Tax=Brucella tritici TaxID=94626 RepID=A0A6N6QBW2_9HYPH|nr:glycoside hydrolase family 108 protein [Brucella tritici]KAB2665188.1 glycoside hydrolase family 108 protein [Brucella tritici]KAB2674035.1 glycoside hydrolase family 108 protein [Brucella tritici]KAB2687393.1 glycoside hydrolase family 108 protein [Brucella tritici]NKW09803.1 glycoside hydrolase family 108 protein [Brucella tritici]